jgi:hypothetical protein
MTMGTATAIRKAKAPKRQPPKPSSSWAQRLQVFQQALVLRQSDAVRNIRAEIGRIGDQVSALQHRRELAPQSAEGRQASYEQAEATRHQRAVDALAQRRAGISAEIEKAVAKLTTEIDGKAAQLADLTGLVKHLKAEPLADDASGTPETKIAARDWIERYRAKARISQLQAAAGEHFALLAEATEISTRSCLNRDVGGGAPDTAMKIAGERLKDSQRQVQIGLEAVGQINSAVVVAVVVQGQSAAAWSKRAKCTEDEAMAMLRAGLDSLVQAFRVDGSGKNR